MVPTIRKVFMRKLYAVLLLFIISSGFLLAILYPCIISIKIQNIDVELDFNKENAHDYIEDQLNIGFRIPGTQARKNCMKYFISKFKKIDGDFSYDIHDFTIHSTACQNLLFKLNENKKNIVILGAHYDSRARATKDSANPESPVPGANDGASGCAVLLELAEIFYEKRTKLDCQIWFLFFDAEDQGYDIGYGMDDWDWCEGSKKFVEDINNFYDINEEHFDCMILLDMVGGINLQFINEQYSSSSLLDELFVIGRNLGHVNEFPIFPHSSSITDDHKAFINKDIPSADLIINFWNNPNWPFHHTTQDDISYISSRSLEITGKTVEQFIFNNYFNDPSKDYRGNYPWEFDISFPSTEIVIFITVFFSIVGLIFLGRKYLHQKELEYSLKHQKEC